MFFLKITLKWSYIWLAWQYNLKNSTFSRKFPQYEIYHSKFPVLFCFTKLRYIAFFTFQTTVYVTLTLMHSVNKTSKFTVLQMLSCRKHNHPTKTSIYLSAKIVPVLRTRKKRQTTASWLRLGASCNDQITSVFLLSFCLWTQIKCMQFLSKVWIKCIRSKLRL